MAKVSTDCTMRATWGVQLIACNKQMNDEIIWIELRLQMFVREIKGEELVITFLNGGPDRSPGMQLERYFMSSPLFYARGHHRQCSKNDFKKEVKRALSSRKWRVLRWPESGRIYGIGIEGGEWGNRHTYPDLETSRRSSLVV